MTTLLRRPWDHKLFIFFVFHEEFLYCDGASDFIIILLCLSPDMGRALALNWLNSLISSEHSCISRDQQIGWLVLYRLYHWAKYAYAFTVAVIVNTRRKRFQKQLQLTDIFVMTYGFLLSSSSSTDTFLRTTRIYFEKLDFFQSQLVIRNHLLFIPGIGII